MQYTKKFYLLLLACLVSILTILLFSNEYHFTIFDHQRIVISHNQSAILSSSSSNATVSSSSTSLTTPRLAPSSTPSTTTTLKSSTLKSTTSKPTSSTNASSSQRTPSASGKRTKNLYIEFMGRFGNVVFEFAAAYSMTLAANINKMFFKDNGQSHRLKQYFPKLKNLINIVPNFPPGISTVNELAPNKFHTKTLQEILAAPKDVHLHGYLGVPSYWWPKYDKNMTNVLEISEAFQNRARKYLLDLAAGKNVSLESRKDSLKPGASQKLPDNVPVLVGIQVRRGDKVHSGDGWVVPQKSYFTKAMAFFRSKYKNLYFIVVSEDKKWAKENIVGKDVILSTSNEDLHELTLLTLCDHTIMSVGTFSWWAAYLAGGDAVYYQNHTRPKTMAFGFFNDTQYFLSHWKPLTN